MQRAPIEQGTFHHLCNRGVDKRIIFLDEEDYRTFLFYLDVMNDTETISPSEFERALREGSRTVPLGKRLVSLCAHCLMPNHFHLLVYELTEGGTSKYLQRVCTAYAMYFNEKYKRSGALFQGPFKNKLVDKYEYLVYVINYIHANPRDILLSQKPSATKKEVVSYISAYPHSSLRFYLDAKTPPRLLQTEVLKEFVELPTNKEEWLEVFYDLEEIRHITIDHK